MSGVPGCLGPAWRGGPESRSLARGHRECLSPHRVTAHRPVAKSSWHRDWPPGLSGTPGPPAAAAPQRPQPGPGGAAGPAALPAGVAPAPASATSAGKANSAGAGCTVTRNDSDIFTYGVGLPSVVSAATVFLSALGCEPHLLDCPLFDDVRRCVIQQPPLFPRDPSCLRLY